MKKLRLTMEDLSVESFALESDRNAKGTVQGHVITPPSDDMSYAAGCTQYCETDGGGRGWTCDTRCYLSQRCGGGGTGNYVTCEGFDSCAPTVPLSCDDATCSPALCL